MTVEKQKSSKDDASNDLVKAALVSSLATSTRLMATLAATPPFFPTPAIASTPPGFAYAPPPPPTTTAHSPCPGIFASAATSFYDDVHDGATTTTATSSSSSNRSSSSSSNIPGQRIYAQKVDGTLEYLGMADPQRPNGY